MTTTISADNGSISGSAGLKSTPDGSGVLALQTGANVTALTIDASQNVGIGTSSPGAKLDLRNGTLRLSTDNSRTTVYGINRGDTGSVNGMSEIEMFGSGTNGYLGNITFSTCGSDVYNASLTERMRIDSSGNLLIGYTSSNGSYKLQVNSQIFATSSTIATSDARYKENVEELSGALDIVKSLRPVSFDWKVHPIHNFDTKTKTVGFLAQDVQQTLAGKPYLNSIIKTNECVIEPEVKDENGTVTKEAVTEEFLGIAEGNMISILTAAIKELKAEVDALRAQVGAK